MPGSLLRFGGSLDCAHERRARLPADLCLPQSSSLPSHFRVNSVRNAKTMNVMASDVSSTVDPLLAWLRLMRPFEAVFRSLPDRRTDGGILLAVDHPTKLDGLSSFPSHWDRA